MLSIADEEAHREYFFGNRKAQISKAKTILVTMMGTSNPREGVQMMVRDDGTYTGYINGGVLKPKFIGRRLWR